MEKRKIWKMPIILIWTLTLLGSVWRQQATSSAQSLIKGNIALGVEGGHINLPCSLPKLLNAPMMKLQGQWTWKPDDGPKEIIVQYIYTTIAAKGKFPVSLRSRTSGNPQRGNITLRVDRLQAGDEGSLQCHFSFSKYGDAKASFRLHVLTVTTNASMPALEGESVSLTCSTPLGTVTWSGPGGVNLSGQTVVTDLVPDPSGWRWTCSVLYDNVTLQASRDIPVLGFVKSPPPTLYTSLGSAHLLPCSLSHLPQSQPLHLRWSQYESVLLMGNYSGKLYPVAGSPGEGPGPLHPASESRGNLSVRLVVRGPVDAGRYRCQISLGDRRIWRDVLVVVVEVSVKPEKPVEGEDVLLSCRVSPQSPNIRVSWRQAGEMGAKQTPKMREGEVTQILSRINISNRGRWVCEVHENGALAWQKDTWLNVTVENLIHSQNNLYLFVGLVAGIVLMLIVATVIIVVLVQRKKRRVRGVRRPRLCQEHSNQPLCQSNEYTDRNRPLPRPPHCPHNPPRRGRSSHAKPKR